MSEITCEESSTERPAASPYATWLRIMAVLYDPFVWLGEIAGMRRRRRRLAADAYGHVVEIGAGTGLNVAHYTDAVSRLVLTEPEPGLSRLWPCASGLQPRARASICGAWRLRKPGRTEMG